MMFHTADAYGIRPMTIKELTEWITVAKQHIDLAKEKDWPGIEHMEQRLDEGLVDLRERLDHL